MDAKSETLEFSNTLFCHATWLSFEIRFALVALRRNPLPELGTGSILLWHDAVAELRLVFTEFLIL